MLLMKPARKIPIPPHKASLNLPRGTEINASDVSHTHLSRESLPTQYSLSQTIKVGKTLCTRSNYSHPRWTLCAVLGNVLFHCPAPTYRAAHGALCLAKTPFLRLLTIPFSIERHRPTSHRVGRRHSPCLLFLADKPHCSQ